ncbi:MAG: peptidase S53 [Phenylobacterium sp.]|nr:MAG: peptidase S53 [Phenylobacterium sp.]
MEAGHSKIQGSERQAPAAAYLHAAAADEPVEVSIYLKDQEPDPLAPGYRPQTEAELGQARQALYGPQLAQLSEFATQHGMTVLDSDPMRRRLKVTGPASALQTAFGTQLGYYRADGQAPFRARVGVLSAPSDIAANIEAVLGFDTRPLATPKLRLAENPHAATQLTPNVVAKLYQFPVAKAANQCIGLIELGGGFRASDNNRAFKAMGLPTPKVTAVSVSGGKNQPGVNTNADGEVALDIQVAGGAAPGAAIAVYFAPNTTQGFVDAITHAVHDQQFKPSVLSISWGSSENGWTQQTINAMSSAFRDAARLGVTVCAAAGDNLAPDGQTDGKAHADYPASDPYVVGCGGTYITFEANEITSEVVWNRGDSGTGGGYSALFPKPPYQQATPGVAQAHRGVPDVGGDADPNSGYDIVVGGVGGAIGGTSAVAPLWAALFALINQDLGKPVGLPHAVLYASPKAFRDIVKGDNKAGGVGFSAAPGWDPCTGLGAPIGGAVLTSFRAAATTTTTAPAKVNAD